MYKKRSLESSETPVLYRGRMMPEDSREDSEAGNGKTSAQSLYSQI